MKDLGRVGMFEKENCWQELKFLMSRRILYSIKYNNFFTPHWDESGIEKWKIIKEEEKWEMKKKIKYKNYDKKEWEHRDSPKPHLWEEIIFVEIMKWINYQ